MPPLSLAVAAIPGLFQALSGTIQSSSASAALRNLKRPQRSTPKSITKAVGVMQGNTMNAMPGEAQMYQRASMSAMNALRAARESAGAGGGINAIQSSLNASYLDIGEKGANFRQAARGQYADSLFRLGQEEDKNWTYNQFAPFADLYQRNMQQYGAGMKNINTGLDSLSLIGSAYLQNK